MSTKYQYIVNIDGVEYYFTGDYPTVDKIPVESGWEYNTLEKEISRVESLGPEPMGPRYRPHRSTYSFWKD